MAWQKTCVGELIRGSNFKRLPQASLVCDGEPYTVARGLSDDRRQWCNWLADYNHWLDLLISWEMINTSFKIPIQFWDIWQPWIAAQLVKWCRSISCCCYFYCVLHRKNSNSSWCLDLISLSLKSSPPKICPFSPTCLLGFNFLVSVCLTFERHLYKNL
jgi:hypothetical protein